MRETRLMICALLLSTTRDRGAEHAAAGRNGSRAGAGPGRALEGGAALRAGRRGPSGDHARRRRLFRRHCRRGAARPRRGSGTDLRAAGRSRPLRRPFRGTRADPRALDAAGHAGQSRPSACPFCCGRRVRTAGPATSARSQDSFTFYLLLSARPDGSFDAVLRNPERDFGTQIGAERLVRDGDDAAADGRAAATRPSASSPAGGLRSGEPGTFTLAFPGRGGTYDFARDGDDSDFYPRGAHPAATPIVRRSRATTAGPPERRRRRHRSRGYRAARPDDPRHADGFDRRAADPRFAGRAARPAGAGGIFPRLQPRPAARHALGGQERHRGRDRRRDPRRRAAQPLEPGLPGDERRRVSGRPRAAEAGDDARASADHVVGLFLRRHQRRGARQRRDDDQPGGGAGLVSLHPARAAGDAARGEQRLLQRQPQSRARHARRARRGESPLDAFDRLVAGPMQIERYGWPSIPSAILMAAAASQIRATRLPQVRPADAERRQLERAADPRSRLRRARRPRRTIICATFSTAISGGSRTIPTRTASSAAIRRAAPAGSGSRSSPSSISSSPSWPAIIPAAPRRPIPPCSSPASSSRRFASAATIRTPPSPSASSPAPMAARPTAAG